MFIGRLLLGLLLVFPSAFAQQEEHVHNVQPEKLGAVSFATSCTPAVQQQFDRALALLHSFAYAPAESKEFATALKNAPGRRGAIEGAVQASQQMSSQK